MRDHYWFNHEDPYVKGCSHFVNHEHYEVKLSYCSQDNGDEEQIVGLDNVSMESKISSFKALHI